MKKLNFSKRNLSIILFSFLFAYILSFLFEGQVLYSILDNAGFDDELFILIAIVTHFLGQFTCGFFCRNAKNAKRVMIICMGICFVLMIFFAIENKVLWMALLGICGYMSGCAFAGWGYFLKEYTPKNERIKSCADVLVYSNIIMILIRVITVSISDTVGFVMSLMCLVAAMIGLWLIPCNDTSEWKIDLKEQVSDIRKPMYILFLFVAVATINSGLMYQVINPEFEHLTWLTSWYWAVPYIVALVVMRNFPGKMSRTRFLYIGMFMIMLAFITFMVLGRGNVDYIVVDTLMLGACGIFDLFWWSIIGEMLDYAKNPVKVFGVGLSSNVFGVLCGDIIGVAVTYAKLPKSEIAVIALCVVCVTLVILPPLNSQLTLLLKSHAFLTSYSKLPVEEKKEIASTIKPLDPLTDRERELLTLVLDGKSNKEIAAASFITENTVKTHLKSIYSKYSVTSRAELISLLLRNQEH